MSLIRIPTEWKEVEVSKLSAKDLNELFSFNNELAKLQQFTMEQSFNLKEQIKIVSVEVVCNEA